MVKGRRGDSPSNWGCVSCKIAILIEEVALVQNDLSSNYSAMPSIAGVPIENPRAQCIVMLFAAPHEMGGYHSKQETISYIREHHWFDIRDEDRLPYPISGY